MNNRPLGKHYCHASGCTVQVPPKMFMCKKHWYMVPKLLQRSVWKHYNPGQENGDAEVTRAYIDVTDEAIRVVRELEKQP